MKQTAVEWLVEQLPKGDFDHQQNVIAQAMEKEKQQQEDFAYWCEWRHDRAFKTYDELLKIYKNETKR
jgi:hypothetical protein